MPRIATVEEELEVSDAFLEKFLPIAHGVAAGKITAREAESMDGLGVDVGGRGVPYGVIRVWNDAKIWRINQKHVEKIVAEFPAPVKIEMAPPPQVIVAPEPERVPETKFDEALKELITGFTERLTEQELEKFENWYSDLAEPYQRKAVEVLNAFLEAPYVPELLKARIGHITEELGLGND